MSSHTPSWFFHFMIDIRWNINSKSCRVQSDFSLNMTQLIAKINHGIVVACKKINRLLKRRWSAQQFKHGICHFVICFLLSHQRQCNENWICQIKNSNILIFVSRISSYSSKRQTCENFKHVNKRSVWRGRTRPRSLWQKTRQTGLNHGYDMTLSISMPIITLRPRRNGQYFANDIFKRIFFNENVWNSINNSLKFVSKGPINNIPALIQVMTWCGPGDKPLSEPMMVSLPTHECVTRPQWVIKQE